MTAKFSYNLTRRMFSHAIRKGWISKGSVVVDPFGGVGTGGIIAAYADLQWIGCELEQKFVDLARENFELHRRKWEGLDCPQPVIIQGDSREMCTVLGAADIILSSPPYATGDSASAESIEHRTDKSAAWIKANTGSACKKGYGSTPGNLGNLKPGDVAAIVSSPPFEDSMVESGDPNYAHKFHGDQQHYGQTAGNIGNDKGPTFWEAAKEIVQQCHQILKPGGHAIWVVKAFVRKGKRVDFPGDWRRLCESVGFTTVCTHHAMLVKETTDNGLFGEITEKKERKSFFRRLAESKGSPPIDYEVILCMEKKQ